MNPFATVSDTTSRLFPIVLAYPRVYQRLLTSQHHDEFQKILVKCYHLAVERPSFDKRHGGFFGMGTRGDAKQLTLFTVWATKRSQPDIFILAGRGDGFGPGHSCPNEEELLGGMYGALIPVPLL